MFMGTKNTQKLVIGPTIGTTMVSLLAHKINPITRHLIVNNRMICHRWKV